jgi:IMP dehydrogenase
MKITECYAYDDVLLVPEYSDITSRTDPSLDTTTIVGGIKLDIPLISSPMDTVTEAAMAISMGAMGGMGVLHRFSNFEDQIEMIDELYQDNHIKSIHNERQAPIVPAVGVTNDEKLRFEKLLSTGFIDMISIDIANGHHALMKQMVDFVKSLDQKLPIMAGNVATGDGFKFMADLGVNAVRVGIGSGSICSTRIKSGFGMPVLSSILDCYQHKNKYPNVAIIADGGIRYPKDVVIALVAGADAVMIGNLFAGTLQAPGGIIQTNDGRKWKQYRGMASVEVQAERKGGLKPGTIPEGVSTLIEYKGSVQPIIGELVGGIKLGMAYGNARNISELRKVKMIKLTDAGVTESHAYGTRR